MSIDRLWDKLEELTRRIEAVEQHDHGPGYHEHLMDDDEFDMHMARHHKRQEPKDKRTGERRGGTERRKSTEKYEGEERRA